MKIKVLIADKPSLLQFGIHTLLSVEEDIKIVDLATNKYEIKELILKYTPDVLLLNLNTSDLQPFEVLEYIHENFPIIKMFALTNCSQNYIFKLIKLGMAGCLLKDEAIEMLVPAIRSIAHGKKWFSETIVKNITQGEMNKSLLTGEAVLTNRERQILSMIAKGYDNSRIYRELFLAEQTVKNYISRIYAKILVNSRTEAVIWARENQFSRE